MTVALDALPTFDPSGSSSGPGVPTLLMRTAAIAVVTAVSGLLFWTIAPTVFGWTPRVVISGSMSPVVQRGDVVVVSRIDPEQIAPGQIISFHDPSRGGVPVLHRVEKIEDGVITTKGDANATEDSTVLHRSDVEGIARLVVPRIGEPQLWKTAGELDKLILLLVVGLALSCACTINPTGAQAGRRH